MQPNPEQEKPTAPVQSSHPLSGRAIIVTGAASGIGRAVALHLASLGVRLALTDVDAEGGKAVCQEVRQLGNKIDVVFATLDVSSDEGVGKLVRTFLKTYKKLDGLVNCAGINLPSPPAHEVTMDFYNKTMSVNAKGTFSFCSHYIRDIVAPTNLSEAPRGGYAIVNVGSTASLKGLENSSAYCASKHAVLGFSRAMAIEYAKDAIRVNVVAPGPIDTPLLHDLLDATDVTVEEACEVLPMKRLGKAEEVASVVAFLLGSDSSYVTGAVIPVDGGWTA